MKKLGGKRLKRLSQFMLILLIYFIGEIIQYAFNLIIPGVVISLLILFLGLCFNIIKIEMIEDACELLLNNMSLFFIPAGVGLMTSFNLMNGIWIPFLLILFNSTIVVWVVTFFTTKLLRRGKIDG